MTSQRNVLVLGATGAMGRYLLPILAEQGYRVDGVSLDDASSGNPNLHYIKADARNRDVLRRLLENRYDGIVDFMIYPTAALAGTLPFLLDRTDHYIYLSSYRVYDNKEHPVRESSPRLLDSSDNLVLRNSDDYSIFKARGENVIRALNRRNWTIIRPAITYSFLRNQLVTLEAADTVGRAFAGKAVVLPEPARQVQATMSWAGDVARMIAALLLNERARCETFTVSTAEHHTWEEIADYYREICNLRAVWVDKEAYLRILRSDPYDNSARWQLDYDRLFDRIMDNTKVLAATGIRQSELISLYDGLQKEISRCPRNYPWPVNAAMDAYLASH